MNEYKHNFFVTLVLFMAISQVQKIKNPFHHSQTSAKAQLRAEKKMKKMEREIKIK
jgi:hypothetical protein